MTAVSVTVDARPALGVLAQLLRAASDLAKPLGAVGFALEQRVALGFEDQRDPWGNPWEPLRPVTLERRRDGGRSGVSILRDTGVMFGSLASAATTNAVEISLSGPQVTTQQFGRASNRFFNTPKGAPAPIPARPMLPIRSGGQVDLPPDWLQDVIDTLTAHLVPA